MNWEKFLTHKKLFKKLVSLSLCAGMVGSQLLSGMPVQAEEPTARETYNLPTDKTINPDITIQHYYNFPAMVLGNMEDEYNKEKINYTNEEYLGTGTGTDAYNKQVNETDLKNYLSGKGSYQNQKPLVVWNTNLRKGQLPSNVDPNFSYGTKRNLDPKSRIVFSDPVQGIVKTESILYKMFADETVPFLLKPQMRYMNKLYNSANENGYNSNYTLSEVWLKSGKNNKDSIKREDFTIIKAPRLNADPSRHDPSKFIFTNNEENANLKGVTPDNHEIRYKVETDSSNNPTQATVLVTNDMVIRLVFEPTEGEQAVNDVDFFDYDITNGKVYADKGGAETLAEDKVLSREEAEERIAKGEKVWVNTKSQGINSYVKNEDGTNKESFLAFGNGETSGHTGLGDSMTWNENTLNKSNDRNRFAPNTSYGTYDGSNLQGATFGLATGMNENGTLQWAPGVNAPALFSTDPRVNSTGRTVYAHDGEQDEKFQLQFERLGGTYTLESVTVKSKDTTTSINHDLTKLPVRVAGIRSNEFWPMDLVSSWGKEGYDVKFGSNARRQYILAGDPAITNENNLLLPASDGGEDHNVYFGMTTTIPFVLQEGYCAPLRYFFYGDDDMFVFLNKVEGEGENKKIVKSTKIADLGGVHTSMGTFVNLWDFIDGENKTFVEQRKDVNGEDETVYAYTIPENQKNAGKASEEQEIQTLAESDTTQKVNADHYELAVYYLERGASGSSCYMRFSVPFQELDMEETAMNGQIMVEKEVKRSEVAEATTPSDDQYEFQLYLQDPNGNELNNKYAIEFYNVTKKSDGTTEDIKIENDSSLPKYISSGDTFKLKDSQKALITGLPRTGPNEVGTTNGGYKYFVKETKRILKDGTQIDLENAADISTTFVSGTIEEGLKQNEYQEGKRFENLIKGENYVKFINAEDPGILVLTKELVTGSVPTEEAFRFHVTLTPPAGKEQMKNVPYILKKGSKSNDPASPRKQELGEKAIGKDGTFTFDIQKDDELILYNIPAGTKYEVTEDTLITENGDYRFDVDSVNGDPTKKESSGTIAATGAANKKIEISFVNNAKEVALVKIPVTKTMTGRDFNGNEQYQFTIESVDPNAPMPENSTITLQNVSESGTATPIASDTLRGEFGPIEFNQSHVGTRYQYTVTEKTGNVEHVEYSKAAYTVNVTVSQDVTTGKLKAESTITDAADNAVDNPRFINDYIQPINVEIPIQKNLEGRDPQTGDEFFFKIEDADNNNPRPVKDLVDKDIVSIQSTTGQDAGSFEFKHLDRTMTGQYKFKISEVAGSVKQLAYDTNVWLVNMDVELIDNKDGGKALNAHVYTTDENANSVDLSEDKPLSFTNTYQATGQLLIPVTKTLKGRQFVNGDRFLFEITGENGAPMPAQTILSMMPTAGEQVTAEFAPILYTEANVGQKYVYQVQEISTGLSGMKYDTTAYTVNVEVSKADKEIVATATYTIGSTSKDKIEFTNDYEPEATLAIPVTKVLTGRAMTPEDKFVFNLEAITQDAPMPEHQQVTIQGNGQDSTANTQFDPIVFESKHAGKSYEYQVTEHRGSINNIEYSGDVYTVNVKVEKDEKGQLTVKPTYFKGDVDQGSVLFTNKYQPSGSWRPMLTKQLLGTQLEADAFAFNMTVTDSDGTVIYNESAQNNQDGTINFKLVTFAKAGRYTAVIQEVKPQNSGDIEYDPNELTYTLDVTDDNGKLVVNELTRSGRDAFVNDAGLRISKQLIAGTGQTLEDADKNYPFPFELDLGAAFAKQTLEAKRIQADGTKKDESLGFDEQGKAKFNLKSDETLIVYGLEAGTPYVVTELTQNNWIDNYLQIDTIGSASGTMSSGVDASVTFRNLKPSTDNAVIHGFKTMSPDGDPFEMKEGTFQFEIRPAGSSSQTATRSEQPNDVEEEPLDESYEVHRSTLPAFEPEEPEQPEEEPEEQPETEPADNEETPAPIDAQLKRKLKLTEREAEIMPASETPLPAKTVVGNNAFGRFEFGEITYTKPGTYVYEILEQNTGISGMTYDRIVFKAIVTVEEWNNSTLKVKSIQYTDSDGNALPNNTMLFTNQYEDKENEPKLTIHKEQSVNFGEFTDTVNAISVDADDVITYKLTVTNSGTAIAKNVVITDVVPAGLILLENSLVDATVDEKGLITWELGDLGVGASRSVTFQVRVPKVDIATTWTNVAHVQGDDQPEKPSNPVSDQSEPGKPEVTIHKYESTPTTPMYDGETPPLRVEAGELVTYDLVVTNEGNEAATEVVVTDIVPKGLEFVQAFDGGQYDENTRKITWNVGTLAANGGTAIVSFQVKVPVVDKDTAWKNTATLTYKEDPEPTPSNTVEIDTIVKNLDIEKWQSVNGDAMQKEILAVNANDTVTYMLHVTNPTEHDVENVFVRDVVPEGLTYVKNSASENGQYDAASRTITWNVGTMPANERKELTFSVTVPTVDKKTTWKNIATLVYEDEDPKPSNEVEVGTDLPQLTIVKDQKFENDAEYTFEKLTGKAGWVLTYRLTVNNPGNATAKDVIVRDTIPTAENQTTPLFLTFVEAGENGRYDPNTQTITWNLGDLAAGESKTVTFKVRIPAVTQNTLWTNQAVTNYENNPNNPEEGGRVDIPSEEVEVDTLVPAVILEKEHKLNDGDRVQTILNAKANDTVTYYLKATNTSLETAHDVWIKDTIPETNGIRLVMQAMDNSLVEPVYDEQTGTMLWKIGDLQPGESKEVWFRVQVPSVKEKTKWTNVATVSHEDNPNNPENPDEPREEIETPPVEVETNVPSLRVVKRQAKNDGALTQTLLQAKAGDKITYAIDVTNDGVGPASQVVIEDIVPEGLELVKGSISDNGVEKDGRITWKLAKLEAGQTRTVTFQVQVPSVKTHTRWTNVASTYSEDDPDPKTTPPVEVETFAPHLTIEKSQKRNEGNRTKDVLAVVGNDRVTYFIKVTSDGEADATDVVVTDAIPEGLTLLEGSVSDEGLVENGQITWHLGTLKTGTSRTVSFAVDVPEAEGVWRNIAEVVESTRPDEPTPSNEVEIKTPNEGPRVTIEKLQAKNDGQPVKTRLKANMGDTITYILRIQNHGTESARQIQVKDAIPDGLRFVEGSITRGGTIENKTITWKIDELKPDETIDLTFQVKVPVVTRNSAWINVGVLVDENGQTPSNEVTVTVEPGTPASSKNGKPTSPKTATQTNQSLWISLLMSAMLVLAGLWVKRKKTQ